MARNSVHIIDVKEALKLRAKGMRWKRVGAELAKLQGRDTPFQADAVQRKAGRGIRALPRSYRA